MFLPMAALGHKQTFRLILPQRLLPGVKQPFEITDPNRRERPQKRQTRMSACPRAAVRIVRNQGK